MGTIQIGALEEIWQMMQDVGKENGYQLVSSLSFGCPRFLNM
jgi:hypothetical protein